MAAELPRKGCRTIIVAMHPGEVDTYVDDNVTVWNLL